MPQQQSIIGALNVNITWHIEQIVVQVGHAKKVRGRARSGYYKVAILLAAAIAEALAHVILKAELSSGTQPPLGGWECYDSHDLPDSHQSSTHRLSVCKRRQVVFQLTDKTDFVRVNQVCKDLGIFSEPFFKKIEKVRKMRNKIHIQSLGVVDRSYTKEQLDSVGYVVDKLIDKLP